MTGFNLPPGCTLADIERTNFDGPVCPDCDTPLVFCGPTAWDVNVTVWRCDTCKCHKNVRGSDEVLPGPPKQKPGPSKPRRKRK